MWGWCLQPVLMAWLVSISDDSCWPIHLPFAPAFEVMAYSYGSPNPHLWYPFSGPFIAPKEFSRATVPSHSFSLSLSNLQGSCLDHSLISSWLALCKVSLVAFNVTACPVIHFSSTTIWAFSAPHATGWPHMAAVTLDIRCRFWVPLVLLLTFNLNIDSGFT